MADEERYPYEGETKPLVKSEHSIKERRVLNLISSTAVGGVFLISDYGLSLIAARAANYEAISSIAYVASRISGEIAIAAAGVGIARYMRSRTRRIIDI